MSQDTPIRPDVFHETVPDSDVEHILQLVRSNALQMLAGFPQPPSALRVRAGGVTVEVEWPTAPPAAGPAALPAPLAASPVAEPAPVTVDDRRYLVAPMVGAFFRSPEPGAKPFVEVGDPVVAGQQVAIVEAMKLMIPVHAELDGRVVEVLKENGDPVEYGERLFALEPTL